MTAAMSQPATISAAMQANAEQAVKYARDRFKSELDYSASSLERVDRIIDVMHLDLPKTFLARAMRKSATEAQVWTVAKMWGAYVGETLRRQWGGRWKSTLNPDGHADVVLDLPLGRCRPIEQVRRRLAEGTGDGVLAMYAGLLAQSNDSAVRGSK